VIRLDAEMADHIYLQRVQEHLRAADRSGLRGTPAFFLDGRLVDVSFGLDRLDEAVRAALMRR
jgi:protein-disulfide isomerase